jgi:amino-acid N-acetyltransferase
MLRKARLTDIKAIFNLISHYAKQGLLLPLTEASICEHIRDFVVYEENGKVMGCAALRIFTPELAEIRSVAVDPEYVGRGVGKELVKFCLDEAKEIGVKRVFVLTKAIPFFERCGFKLVNKRELPQKVWRDCMGCPKFPECDEVAMIKVLEE